MSSLRRGIVRMRVLYPRLVPIAAVVSRATEVTSRLRRDKLQFENPDGDAVRVCVLIRGIDCNSGLMLGAVANCDKI